MNRPTKEVDRKHCAPFSKEALAIHSGATRRFRRSRDHVLPAKGETSNLQSPRGTGRSWLVLAALASLFVSTSCDTQNKEKAYSVSNRDGINSQGIAAHEVEKARQEFRVDGSGVKVCVIGDSIKHLGEGGYISRRDVDVPTVDGREQTGIFDEKHSGKGEGTAMLEIIHSIAPGAKLGFATGQDEVHDDEHNARRMAENIKALFGERCQIFVDDWEVRNQSPFQDDEVAQAINEVTAHGALYITSAGNQGNTAAGMSGAWEGYFKASGKTADGRIMHTFAPGEQNGEYNAVLGNCGRTPKRDGSDVEVDAHLYWSDRIAPHGESRPHDSSSYNLWAVGVNGALKDANGCYVTSAYRFIRGECRRVGGEKPYRYIHFPAPNRTDSNRTWIVITKAPDAPDRFLHLDFRARDGNDCRLQYATGGVISGHHGAEAVLSVASKSALKNDSLLGPAGAFLGGPGENVNFSSSEGPRHIFFTADGHPYNSPRVLKKPDVTAADGVMTDVPEIQHSFYGTSAAAPQVAGIAALMWSKDPSLTAEQIKEALRESAIQIEGNEKWNPLSGYGIVNALRALRAIEMLKGRQVSSCVCAEDYRRSSRVAHPLRSSMARRYSAPLK